MLTRMAREQGAPHHDLDSLHPRGVAAAGPVVVCDATRSRQGIVSTPDRGVLFGAVRLQPGLHPAVVSLLVHVLSSTRTAGFRVQGPRRLDTPKVYDGEVCLSIAADDASRTTARTAGLTAAFVRSASR